MRRSQGVTRQFKDLRRKVKNTKGKEAAEFHSCFLKGTWKSKKPFTGTAEAGRRAREIGARKRLWPI